MPDGTVEVLAIGKAEALDNLRQWLRKGPPMAKVSELTEAETDLEDRASFEIA